MSEECRNGQAEMSQQTSDAGDNGMPSSMAPQEIRDKTHGIKMTAQTLDPPFPACVTEDTLFKAFEPYGLHL